MKRTGQIIAYAILGIFMVVALIVMPIIDLANTDKQRELTIVYAEEYAQLEHSISYLIPFGSDYFYIGMDDSDKLYLIKAEKGWAEKHFGDDYGAVEIKALITSPDSEVRTEFQKDMQKLGSSNFPLGVQCLDTQYVGSAVMRLVSGILGIILVVLGMLFAPQAAGLPKFVKVIYSVLVLAVLLMALFGLR